MTEPASWKVAWAEDLAARTLAAIPSPRRGTVLRVVARTYAADRERIASDLEGWKAHSRYQDDSPGPTLCLDAGCVDEGREWPCPDARRYGGNLIRTAGVYGVKPK